MLRARGGDTGGGGGGARGGDTGGGGGGGGEGSSPLTFYLGGQNPPTLLQYMHVISIDINFDKLGLTHEPLASSPGSQKKWEEEERNESLVSTVFRERTNLPRNDKL